MASQITMRGLDAKRRVDEILMSCRLSYLPLRPISYPLEDKKSGYGDLVCTRYSSQMCFANTRLNATVKALFLVSFLYKSNQIINKTGGIYHLRESGEYWGFYRAVALSLKAVVQLTCLSVSQSRCGRRGGLNVSQHCAVGPGHRRSSPRRDGTSPRLHLTWFLPPLNAQLSRSKHLSERRHPHFRSPPSCLTFLSQRRLLFFHKFPDWPDRLPSSSASTAKKKIITFLTVLALIKLKSHDDHVILVEHYYLWGDLQNACRRLYLFI